MDYLWLTQETDQGDRTGLPGPRFPSFANPSGPLEPLSTDIASERLILWSIRPSDKSTVKLEPRLPFGAAVFHLNG